jgi:hypothetical protein
VLRSHASRARKSRDLRARGVGGLRLRGGVARGWQYRISNETLHIVNSSSYMQDWWNNSTEEWRPFCQQDSLLHMAKLWRERYVGPSGMLEADPLSRSFLPGQGQKKQDSERRMEVEEAAGGEEGHKDGKVHGLGLWVNTALDRPCVLLGPDTLGIGGETLAEYCSRREKEGVKGEGRGASEERFEYALQEDWFKLGLYIDASILFHLPGQNLIAGGGEEMLLKVLAQELALDETKVLSEGGFRDEFGRELLDVATPFLPQRSSLKIAVICDDDVRLAHTIRSRMLEPGFLPSLHNRLREKLRGDGVEVQQGQDDGGAGGGRESWKRKDEQGSSWGSGWAQTPTVQDRGGDGDGDGDEGMKGGKQGVAQGGHGGGAASASSATRCVLEWKVWPHVNNPAFRCPVCEEAYTHHAVVLDTALVARAYAMSCEGEGGEVVRDCSYRGGIPLEDRVRQGLLTFVLPEPNANSLLIRRLANLDFTNTTEVLALRKLGVLDDVDPVAEMAAMTHGLWKDPLEGHNNVTDPRDAYGPGPEQPYRPGVEDDGSPAVGSQERPLPAGLGPGPGGSFVDPICYDFRDYGHVDGGLEIKAIDDEVRRQLHVAAEERGITGDHVVYPGEPVASDEAESSSDDEEDEEDEEGEGRGEESKEAAAHVRKVHAADGGGGRDLDVHAMVDKGSEGRAEARQADWQRHRQRHGQTETEGREVEGEDSNEGQREKMSEEQRMLEEALLGTALAPPAPPPPTSSISSAPDSYQAQSHVPRDDRGEGGDGGVGAGERAGEMEDSDAAGRDDKSGMTG